MSSNHLGLKMPTWKWRRAYELLKNQTPAERAFREAWRKLKTGIRLHAQRPMLGYIADFYIHEAKTIIELDGGYHKTRGVEDVKRDAVFLKAGIDTIRLTNERVLSNPDDAARLILSIVRARVI